MAYGTRAEMLEEKRRRRQEDADRRSRIKKANKSLLVAPKKTQRSLGIIQIDPEGVLHFQDGRWMSFLEVTGGMKHFPTAAESIGCRSIFTAVMGEETRFFLTLIREGDIYEPVRAAFLEDEEILRDGMKVRKLSAEEAFDAMRKISMIEQPFSFETLMKKRKDLGQMVLPHVIGGYETFGIGEDAGTGFFIMQYPQQLTCSVLKEACMIAGRIIFSFSYNPVSEQRREEYLAYLSKRYAKDVKEEMVRPFGSAYAAVTAFCVKSKDIQAVRKRIQETFADAGFMIAPCYDDQKKCVLSQLSLGMIDKAKPQNVTRDMMQELFKKEFCHDPDKV
ncbi:MAG: hypothetical protein K6E75_11310 [Lachnospiraceae bacterium]|nr:hypothetical protein [Lachnospiraceae bacterium]